MRSIFLFGGLLGFVLAALASWQADHHADRIFLDASIGCLAAGLLFRWLWTVILRALRETILTRQEALTAAATAKSKS